MGDNDLQFNDHDIDELRDVDSFYLGDISKHKKNDDFRIRQQPEIGIPKPDPFIEHSPPPPQQPPPRRHRAPSQPVHAQRAPGTRLCKLFAALGFISCTLFLFGIIATSALDTFRHHGHDDSGHGVHSPAPIALAQGEGNGGALAVVDATPEFRLELTTTEAIQTFVAYDLSNSFPSLDFDSLSNYRICCWSKSKKFICGSGYTFSNGLALDGYLAQEDETHISLYLLVNSLDLSASRCELTLWTKPD